MTRPYDITLFGATGFTGRLVADYLAEHAPDGLSWAIAGRNRAKLEAIQRELERSGPGGSGVGLVVADVKRPDSLLQMAEQSRVVVTTVGPYADYGEPVVRACVEGGADYLDITGEPSFVSRVLARYGEAAEDAGVLVISCCGFDSIPADLGAMFCAQQLYGDAPKTVEAYVKAKGRPSGGTWASLVKAVSRLGSSADRSSGGGKGEEDARRRKYDAMDARRERRKKGPRLHFNRSIGRWGVPMPVIDPVLVKRSSRARPQVYGPSFTYKQYLSLRSFPQVAGLMGFVGGLFVLTRFAFTRQWLLSLRPSGDGPSAEERKNGFFELTFLGRDEAGREVRTRVAGGDPGYDETAKMLSECALMLATERGSAAQQAGVTTPAAALGDRLRERLVAAGIVFEVI